MNIAFWSNSNDTFKVSYHLSAISIASVLRYPYSVTVFENHIHKDNLGVSYFGKERVHYIQEVGTNYYEGGGIEGLLRRIYREDEQPIPLKLYLKEVIKKHLYYIPQSRFISSELFDYEFSINQDKLMDLLSSTTDLCYINTASNTLSTKSILETVDFIIVLLSPISNHLDDFFTNYSSLIPKSMFILTDYSKDAIPFYRQLISKYGLSPEVITRIPYNDEFMEAYQNGRAVEFMLRNYKCLPEHQNYVFVQGIRRITAMLMNQISIVEKEKVEA